MILEEEILVELEDTGEQGRTHTHTNSTKNYNTQLNKKLYLTTCTNKQKKFCIFRFFVSYVSRGETHTPTHPTHKLKENITHHYSHYKVGASLHI